MNQKRQELDRECQNIQRARQAREAASRREMERLTRLHEEGERRANELRQLERQRPGGRR